MPVEDFPPAINTARYFAQKPGWDVSLCTNRSHLGRAEFRHEAVDVVRGIFPTGKSGIRRFLAYGSFHLKSLFKLLKIKPDVILYIEPHSALPAFLSRLFTRRPRIFIHYHEYHSPAEFDKPGMRMAKWFHHLEKYWLYPAAEWISQTNESRLKLFLEDNPEIATSKLNILPNYPPSCWWEGVNRAWPQAEAGKQPLRIVYVGALSRADTFIEEAVAWVKELGPATAILDIYSYNLHGETRAWLNDEADDQIRFHDQGIAYDELPQLLRGFHAGLILYKSNTPNYVYNATNKLFEYLACGLDVIYPRQMIGVKSFASLVTRPRVIECDFENMVGFSFQPDERQWLPVSGKKYCCETELARLEQAMLE